MNVLWAQSVTEKLLVAECLVIKVHICRGLPEYESCIACTPSLQLHLSQIPLIDSSLCAPSGEVHDLMALIEQAVYAINSVQQGYR